MRQRLLWRARTSPPARGQILILFALAAVAMMVGMVLAIDAGNIYLQARTAQNAADAAALAGVRCMAKQWLLADPEINSGASNAQKCEESGSGQNVWTQAARAVNCNQAAAPLAIESITYVASDGVTVLASVTGTQGGCPSSGGAAPTSVDGNATGATSYSTASGLRVRVRANVTTFFVGAALAGIGRASIATSEAGATNSDGTYPVRASAAAQLGAVGNPSTITAPVTPFMLCATASKWDGSGSVSLVNPDGTVNTAWVGTKFVLAGQDADTCGSPTGQAFNGQTKDSAEGATASAGAQVAYEPGVIQSEITGGLATLCGAQTPTPDQTACFATLALVNCSEATSSSVACEVKSWATFKIAYESKSGQNRVSATLMSSAAAPVPGGTVTSWTTFGDPGAVATALKLSG